MQSLILLHRLGRPGPYRVQAAIAGLHDQAPDREVTDRPQIAALHAVPERHGPSPVVAVNRAAAVGVAEGPGAGLAANALSGNPAERAALERRRACGHS
jgi:predicted RNA polymerase sigma factor